MLTVISNDLSLVFFTLARCSLFSHCPHMTMPCELAIHQFTPVRFYDIRVSTGFSSPTNKYKERKLDLNELIIKQPEATFFAKTSGDSMIGEGI